MSALFQKEFAGSCINRSMPNNRVCRIGDPWDCGDTQGEGSGDVFANGIPVSRLGDNTAGHCYPPVPIVSAAAAVFANGIPVATIGDPHPGHCCGPPCHGGSVLDGSPDVYCEA